MSDAQSKFQIEVGDGSTLERDDPVAHSQHGPMTVERITISAVGKRARLQSELREDRMSIELTEEEIQEQWGETLAADPFEFDNKTTRYKNEFSSKDDEIEVTLEVSGPEDDAEPVMAHLHDQTIRVLQAMESGLMPSDCEGAFDIDWEAILAEEGEDSE